MYQGVHLHVKDAHCGSHDNCKKWPDANMIDVCSAAIDFHTHSTSLDTDLCRKKSIMNAGCGCKLQMRNEKTVVRLRPRHHRNRKTEEMCVGVK